MEDANLALARQVLYVSPPAADCRYCLQRAPGPMCHQRGNISHYITILNIQIRRKLTIEYNHNLQLLFN